MTPFLRANSFFIFEEFIKENQFIVFFFSLLVSSFLLFLFIFGYHLCAELRIEGSGSTMLSRSDVDPSSIIKYKQNEDNQQQTNK